MTGWICRFLTLLGVNEQGPRATVVCDAGECVTARLSSHVRDSYFQPIFAHTSPVYMRAGRRAAEQPEAAHFFDRAIDDALGWVQQKGKYANDTQRKEVLILFREGQAVYRGLG